MKSHIIPSRIVLFVFFALAGSLHAQSNPTPPALGLLRLTTTTRVSDPAPLAPGKFAVDDLSPANTAGTARSKRDNLEYLVLTAGKDWSRPLRGNGREVTYVSFQVYASEGTIIEAAGARLGVTAGPVPNSVQLMHDRAGARGLEWHPLDFHAGTVIVDGRRVAMLQTLTLRIDPQQAVCDVFLGSRLLAGDLPLMAEGRDQRRISFRAGRDGLLLTGLVLSDENPLYVDDNANGIDDAFERTRLGSPLRSDAPASERRALAYQWREHQRSSPPPPLQFVALRRD